MKNQNDININSFAKEVYKNAVNHGWYGEDTEHSFGDVIALCHSELSEALEEYRNGKPDVYFYDENGEIVKPVWRSETRRQSNGNDRLHYSYS